ncbi:unnamed protein product [Laminaria digitata]
MVRSAPSVQRMVRHESLALPASTALHDAAGAGDDGAIAGLLLCDDADIDVDARISEQPLYANGVTALHVAAQRGHLGVVLALLEGGAGPSGGWHELYSDDVEGTTGDWHYWHDRVCENDPTPLHEAVVRGHVEIVRALLANGARRNARTTMAKCRSVQPGDGKLASEHAVGGHVPLHFAARSGQAEVVHALVDAGANVNILGGNRAETPLHVATRHGHTAVMLALLHRGADINAGDADNRTALHAAVSVQALDFLLVAGADRNGRATHCAPPLPTETPLGRLCAKTHVRWTSAAEVEKATALVQTFLRHGADTVSQTQDQQGVLINTAATTCSPPSAAPSPDHPQPSPGSGDITSSPCSTCPTPGPPIDCKPPRSSSGSASGLLLESKAIPPGCKRSTGPTEAFSSPSGSSASNDDPPCTTRPAAEEPPTKRISLLFCAAKNGVPGIVAALLDAGLNPKQRDEDGVTAAHYAAQEGHLETLRLLLLAGADADATIRREKWTPLHVACYCDRLECVVELLRHGANLKARCFLPGVGVKCDASAPRSRYRTPLEMVGLRWYSSNPKRRTAPTLKYEEDEVEQEGCGEKMPAEARTVAGATAATSPAPAPAAGPAGDRTTSVTIRNAIRRVLRCEDRWRRRGGIIVFQALLTKHMMRTITSAVNTTTTTTTIVTTTTTLLPPAMSITKSEIAAGLGTTTTTRTTTDVNHGRTYELSEEFSEDRSCGGEFLRGDATPPVAKMCKYGEGGGCGKQEPSTMEVHEWDRLLGALAGLMDMSWGDELLFRQIVMRL